MYRCWILCLLEEEISPSGTRHPQHVFPAIPHVALHPLVHPEVSTTGGGCDLHFFTLRVPFPWAAQTSWLAAWEGVVENGRVVHSCDQSENADIAHKQNRVLLRNVK